LRCTNADGNDREIERLDALARRTGRPRAELVREAIAAYDPQPPGELSFVGAGAGDGTSVGDLEREDLLEGFGEPR
jgi:hypothetical protein